jgi:DNA polymerase zeta
MGLVDLLPFFDQNMEENKQNESFQHMENSEFAGGVLGVPTHFQNDGSALYLLTHALAPPSAVAVGNWLTQQSCSSKFCIKHFLHGLFFC